MSLKRITTKEGEVYFVDATTGERVDVNRKTPSGVSGAFMFIATILITISIIAFIGGLAIDSSFSTEMWIAGLAGILNSFLLYAFALTIRYVEQINLAMQKNNSLLEHFLKNNK